MTVYKETLLAKSKPNYGTDVSDLLESLRFIFKGDAHTTTEIDEIERNPSDRYKMRAIQYLIQAHDSRQRTGRVFGKPNVELGIRTQVRRTI